MEQLPAECPASEPSFARPGAEDQEPSADPSTAPPEAVVSVDIDATAESVWEALTTDAGLREWIGDGSQIGDRPGDDLRFNDVVSGEHKRGVLDEVTPHRRLGYTWWPETAPHDATRVAISLEPSSSGTRVTVVESRPLRTPLTPGSPSAHAPRASTVSATDWNWRVALLAFSLTSGARPLPVLHLVAGR